MIHQSITKRTQSLSFSEVKTDEKENLRTVYNREKMESLKTFIQSSGEIGFVKAVEKVYKDGTKEIILADGYRRNRVVNELGLQNEPYDFTVYQIRENAFESKEAFELEYQKLFIYLGASTQESESWCQVTYGKAILRLENENPNIKQVEIANLLNKSASYISTARKYALICQNELIYNAYEKELISIELIRKVYANSHDVEQTQSQLLEYLNNSEGDYTTDIPEVLESDFDGFEDYDPDNQFDNTPDAEKSEQEGLLIEDGSFDIRKFKLYIFDMYALSLSQQKGIISLVDAFLQGTEVNQESIAYELSQLRLTPQKSEHVEVDDDSTDIDFL